MKMLKQTKIGKHVLGTDSSPLFLPDIDVYFKKDIELGRSLIKQLHSYGVSTIKGALLHNPEICLPEGDTRYYVPGKGFRVENYRAIVERHSIPLNILRELYSEAKDLGMDLALSIYDFEGLELATELECSLLKIPSSNIVHHPLIHAAATSGVPIIIDTGRSSQHEIDRAINWAKSSGAETIIIQHSPPGPPAKATTFNLPLMISHGKKHSCYNGLSDHYSGTEIMLAATALGADVIEKGICPDGASPDIDISHALQISQVPELLDQMLLIHDSLKVSALPPQPTPPADRMCLVAKHDIQIGSQLSLENIYFAFPPIGVNVENWEQLEGKKINTHIVAGEPVKWEYIEK
jgi:N,N'-diacetyllegionaminate synthase